MTAADAINGARAAGLHLSVADGELQVHGPAPLVEVWKRPLEGQRREIVRLLSRRASARDVAFCGCLGTTH